jgi:tRNA1(Val) A37 N6-methylase TrmN6
MTAESFLGGRVMIVQGGLRAGLDAVMLAAAIPARAGQSALELGSGSGVASLCLAARTKAHVSGIEIDAALASLANENAKTNGTPTDFFAGDIFDPPQQLRRDFDHVFCNPPFHEGEGSIALHDNGKLGDWLTTGLKRTVSNGSFTTIIRADRLSEALAALPTGGVSVFPLWPKEGVPAKRVILRVWKSSRAPLVLLPGLILHRADGANTPEAEAILRDGASLALENGRL